MAPFTTRFAVCFCYKSLIGITTTSIQHKCSDPNLNDIIGIQLDVLSVIMISSWMGSSHVERRQWKAIFFVCAFANNPTRYTEYMYVFEPNTCIHAQLKRYIFWTILSASRMCSNITAEWKTDAFSVCVISSFEQKGFIFSRQTYSPLKLATGTRTYTRILYVDICYTIHSKNLLI